MVHSKTKLKKIPFAKIRTFTPILRVLSSARFAGGVAGVRPRLEKPRPRLENISKNAAGVEF